MDYTEVFSRAWRIFRGARTLWIMGVLSAFFGEGEYSFSANVNQQINATPGGPTPELPPFFEGETFRSFIENPWPYLLPLIGAVLVMSLIRMVIGSIMRGALIHMTGEAEREAPIALMASLRAGWGRLAPVFLIGLIVALPSLLVMIVALVLFIPLFFQIIRNPGELDPSQMLPTLLGAVACFLPLTLISVVLSLVLSLIERLALRSCVLDHLGVGASMRQGWQLIRRNLGRVLFTWFVLAAAGVLFSLLAALPAFAVLLPLSTGLFQPGWETNLVASFVFLFLYGLVVGVGIGGVLSSYNATVWTVLYTSIRARDQEPQSA